ncbi:MAG: hypothetical protein JXB49_06265 [Bacteroidales bacterium]|nr:hypothetical protein [Bacteroidales bacterium]
MNNINKTRIISYLVIIFLTTSILFISCKEEEKLGPPVINKVRLIDPEKADSSITIADPGTMVVIEGENFINLLKVYFNDYEASFNRIFVTNTNIIVRIPEETPTAINNPLVSNEITVITETGFTTHSFFLNYPAPVIQTISNENALPGDTIYITGTNFFFIEKIIFPGEIEATNFEILDEVNGIAQIQVPTNLTESGIITFITPRDTVFSPMKFNDISGDDVICNFDDINTFIWGCLISADNNAFPGARGSFAHLSTTNIAVGSYDWWTNNKVCFLDSINIIPPQNMGDQITDYQLKFEMYVNKPWNTGNLTIIISDWNYRCILRPWIVNGKRTNYVTNGWVTYTVPLSEFRGSEGTGSPASQLNNLFWANGDARIGFPFMNDGANPDNPETEGLLLEELSIAIDNIRLIKVTN